MIATRSQTSSTSRQQVRVQQHARRRGRAAPRAARARCAGRRGRARSSARRAAAAAATPISACAMPSRCCMPFDIVPMRRSRASASPTSSSSSARSAAPPADPARRWWRSSSSSADAPVGEAEELGEVAERALRGRRAGRRAADLGARPAVGRTSPQAILTRVDLPAPFGPSRPTSSPSPTSRSTPTSALDGAVGLVEAGDGERGGHEPDIVADRSARDGAGRRKPAHRATLRAMRR